MLPGAASPAWRPEYELHGANREAREVGGDFYDFFPLAGDRLALLIADVSGKGIPAALFMAVSRTLLKDACLRAENPAGPGPGQPGPVPGERGLHVRHRVPGVLRHRQRPPGVANGGHPGPGCCAPGAAGKTSGASATPCSTRGPITSSAAAMSSSQAGDTLFMYTDGVTEAMSPGGEAFGTARLEGLLADTAALPAEAMGRRIVATLDDYQAGTPFDVYHPAHPEKRT
ncbi:MAG: SpoIIE family protein phosphatase [Hydrogenophilales bacterium]|nr:SpoIIE family protein phosphatase [Hydrogenophilales bacterium]